MAFLSFSQIIIKGVDSWWTDQAAKVWEARQKQIKQTNKLFNDLCIWGFTASKINVVALIFVS